MKNLDVLLKAAVARVAGADPSLGRELESVRQSRAGTAATLEGWFLESGAGPAPHVPPQLVLETIVLRVGRPVLAVVHGAARLEFGDVESEVWRSRLEAARDRLTPPTHAVGRIDVVGHPRLDWVGTGWLVADGIVATNRHVAREFGRRTGDRFGFRTALTGRPMRASIDFLREVDRDERLDLTIVDILHIEDDEGPDLALLRVEVTSERGSVAEPIALATDPVTLEQHIAVVGYPARDSRVPDQALMQSIFGDVYERKRLAPGQVTNASGTAVLHDCSTLGGNSGSVLLDLATGRAVGLHFAGRFLEANYAVPARVVADRLERVRRTRPSSQGSGMPTRPDAPTGQSPSAPDIQTPGVAPLSNAGGSVTWTIPLRVTVELGRAEILRAAHQMTTQRPSSVPAAAEPDEDFVEGVPDDYLDRAGYDPRFLGVEVPLPTITRNAGDVLTFPWQGAETSELKYEHFSVVMSRSRRVCVFSAVNIDGKQSRRGKRPPWRRDPRIPADRQIKSECYGNAPKFSRGHMTRREDPIWGEEQAAARGNADSMHVTNTAPQMQVFNAGIWLGLEDYALEHAREDSMRISVMTGPFLEEDDPVRFGVRIPRVFWKVIAFIHDETNELCATGYTMSQEDFLREEEFVFGQHQTAQASIRSIEERAGLSFGPLAARDPFDSIEEAPLGALTDFSQIVFVRS